MDIIKLTPPEELEAELLYEERRLEAYIREPDSENLREKVYQELCEQDWRP